EQLREAVAHTGVEALLGLVEEEEGAGAHEGGGEQHTSALSGGQRRGQGVGTVVETEVRDEVGDEVAGVRDAVPEGGEEEVLRDGEGGEERIVAEDGGHGGALVPGAGVRRGTEELDPPA